MSPSRQLERGFSRQFYQGRMWLIGIFCALRVVDMLIYTLVLVGPEAANYTRVHAFTIATGLWSSALLIGMWRRQAWARLLLTGMILANGVFGLVWLPASFAEVPHSLMNLLLLASCAVDGSIAYVLVAVKAVQRLTDQRYS